MGGDMSYVKVEKMPAYFVEKPRINPITVGILLHSVGQVCGDVEKHQNQRLPFGHFYECFYSKLEELQDISLNPLSYIEDSHTVQVKSKFLARLLRLVSILPQNMIRSNIHAPEILDTQSRKELLRFYEAYSTVKVECYGPIGEALFHAVRQTDDMCTKKVSDIWIMCYSLLLRHYVPLVVRRNKRRNSLRLISAPYDLSSDAYSSYSSGSDEADWQDIKNVTPPLTPLRTPPLTSPLTLTPPRTPPRTPPLTPPLTPPTTPPLSPSLSPIASRKSASALKPPLLKRRSLERMIAERRIRQHTNRGHLLPPPRPSRYARKDLLHIVRRVEDDALSQRHARRTKSVSTKRPPLHHLSRRPKTWAGESRKNLPRTKNKHTELENYSNGSAQIPRKHSNGSAQIPRKHNKKKKIQVHSRYSPPSHPKLRIREKIPRPRKVESQSARRNSAPSILDTSFVL